MTCVEQRGLVPGATGRTVQVRRPQWAVLHEEVICAKRQGVNNPAYRFAAAPR